MNEDKINKRCEICQGNHGPFRQGLKIECENQFPDQPHLAILVFDKHNESQHGETYPVKHTNYLVFTDEEAWKKKITALKLEKFKSFVVFKATGRGNVVPNYTVEVENL